MSFPEVSFEGRPSFFTFWFAIPVSNGIGELACLEQNHVCSTNALRSRKGDRCMFCQLKEVL